VQRWDLRVTTDAGAQRFASLVRERIWEVIEF